MRIPARDILLLSLVLGLPLAPVAAGQTPPEAEKADSAQPAGREGGQGADSERVLARVNGEPVMADDVAARLATQHESATGAAGRDFDLDRLMSSVVNDVLLGQEARTMGLDQDPAVRSEVDEYRDELVLKLLERVEIEEKSRPTEEEVRRVFEDQYRRVDLRTVTALDKETAAAMLERLQAGADMAEMARNESVDPYAMRGGLAPDIVRYDMRPELAEATFSVEAGSLAGPIRTDLGWTILRPEAFRQADPARWQELEPLCRRMARFYKGQALRQALAARIQKEIPVTIDREAAASVEAERLPDGRLMPRVPDKEAIVARIGPEVVLTAGEYSRGLVDRWKGVRNLEAAEAAAPIILSNMVEHKLLLAEAYRRGYRERRQIVSRVQAFETQQLIPLFLERVVVSRVEVTPDMMKAYYEANKERFHRPPRLRLGQITVATLDEAEEIVRQLRQGTDLAWLAREKSIDGYKDRGGDRGWFVPTPGVDEFNDTLMEAPAGTVLDPAGAPGNVMVVKVLAREEQGIFDYDEMSGNLRQMVFQEEFKKELAKFMETLRARADITIDREALSQLTITGSPRRPDGETEHGGTGHGS